MPQKYKENTISMLTRKVLELSDERFQAKNFELIRKTLLSNGYPLKLINRIMQNTTQKLLNDTSTVEVQRPDPKFRLCIRYEPVIFGKLKKLFAEFEVQIVAKSQQNLGSLLFSKLKDKIELSHRSNVVYCVTCNCGVKYVGKTCQHLEQRIKQHSKGGPEHSALSLHLNENGHTIDLNNVKILCTEQHRGKLSIKEMVHIRKTDCINWQTDCEKLGNGYDNLIF